MVGGPSSPWGSGCSQRGHWAGNAPLSVAGTFHPQTSHLLCLCPHLEVVLNFHSLYGFSSEEILLGHLLLYIFFFNLS